jgi:glycosyltransferase involved in cell wall biosynthesis
MKSSKTASSANTVRVLYVVTSSQSLRFLRGHLGYLRVAGFDVTIVCPPGDEVSDVREDEGVRTISVPMVRHVSPWRDFVSLLKLCAVMRKIRPTIVNVSTPKAGLLGGLATWICSVPCRLYTLRGLRCETATGPRYLLLMICDYIACSCAHRVICVSQSVRQKALSLGLLKPEKSIVLGSGSSNGIDGSRFHPVAARAERLVGLRKRLGIPAEAPVLGFVGRLTRDKGIRELLEAYSRLRQSLPEIKLLIVGDFEKGDLLSRTLRRRVENDRGIVKTGFVRDPSPYYHLMDVLALPSHREGFPNVALEANAAGKPVVATRSTGSVDAIINGVTGILVPVGDIPALAAALQLLFQEKHVAASLGAAGRERVLREFRQETIWEAMLDEYLHLLRAKGLPLPSPANRELVLSMPSSASSISQ